jgi:hypothetical protein
MNMDVSASASLPLMGGTEGGVEPCEPKREGHHAQMVPPRRRRTAVSRIGDVVHRQTAPWAPRSWLAFYPPQDAATELPRRPVITFPSPTRKRPHVQSF